MLWICGVRNQFDLLETEVRTLRHDLEILQLSLMELEERLQAHQKEEEGKTSDHALEDVIENVMDIVPSTPVSFLVKILMRIIR